MSDRDPFDYCRIERKIPASKELKVAFDIKADQNDKGLLQIEFLDENSIACARIDLNPDGTMLSKGGARYGKLLNYEAGKSYHVEVILSVSKRMSEVFIDGKKQVNACFVTGSGY